MPQPNVEGFPLHDALSKVSPNNPVMLEHASGHASFVNAKAMEAAGITRDDAEPARRRDPEGRGRPPDRRAARDRVGSRRAARWTAWRSEEDAGRARRRRAPADRAGGAGQPREGHHVVPGRRRELRHHRRAQAGRRRRHARHPPVGDGARQRTTTSRRSCAQYKAVGLDDNHLTIAAIKMTADGALGSRGAWMLEPYSDSPASIGLNDDAGARASRRPGGDRARERRAAVRARDRRPRQPRGAQHLRARVQGAIPT